MLIRRWSVFAGLWTTGEVSLRFFRLILCVPMQDVFLVGAVVLHFVEYRLPLRLLRILYGHFFRSLRPVPSRVPKHPKLRWTRLDRCRRNGAGQGQIRLIKQTDQRARRPRAPVKVGPHVGTELAACGADEVGLDIRQCAQAHLSAAL